MTDVDMTEIDMTDVDMVSFTARGTGWLRLVGSLKFWVSSAEYSLFL